MISSTDLWKKIEDRIEPEKSIGVSWAADLPSRINLQDEIHLLERVLLERALKQANGVKAEAARKLDISRSHIGYMLRKHHLTV